MSLSKIYFKYKFLKPILLLGIIVGSSCFLNGNYDFNNASFAVSKSNEEDSNYWITDLADMPTVRGYLDCAVYEGEIYCFGGNQGSTRYGQIEVYNPKLNTWTTKNSTLPTLRNSLRALTCGDKIYVVGGFVQGHQGEVHI